MEGRRFFLLACYECDAGPVNSSFTMICAEPGVHLRQLYRGRDEILRLAEERGAKRIRLFGSVTMLVVWLATGSLDVPRPVRSLSAPAGSNVEMVGYSSTIVDALLLFGVGPLRDDAVAPRIASSPGDTVVIASVGIELSYDVKEIQATTGDTLTIRYDNSKSEMAHNFVLVRSEEDITAVGNAALNAHRNDYIPEEEMDRIIIHSRLLYPGESDTFLFVVPPPGTYPYICTYSGHFTMMQGRLISTE